MNEQIEEMANDIAKICPDLVENGCGQINCVTHLTLSLYNAGYRKQSEVAREIFEEIERLIEITAFADCWSEGGFKKDLAKLKKKYTEEKT